MNDRVYDVANLIGLLLIGIGTGLLSVPAALIVVGALIIILTIIGRFLWWRRRP